MIDGSYWMCVTTERLEAKYIFYTCTCFQYLTSTVTRQVLSKVKVGHSVYTIGSIQWDLYWGPHLV